MPVCTIALVGSMEGFFKDKAGRVLACMGFAPKSEETVCKHAFDTTMQGSSRKVFLEFGLKESLYSER